MMELAHGLFRHYSFKSQFAGQIYPLSKSRIHLYIGQADRERERERDLDVSHLHSRAHIHECMVQFSALHYSPTMKAESFIGPFWPGSAASLALHVGCAKTL